MELTGGTLAVFQASTAHIHPETDQTALREVSSYRGPFGFLISTGSSDQPSPIEQDERATNELKKLIQAAREQGYEYILFDRDGPVHDYLPDFLDEWDKQISDE